MSPETGKILNSMLDIMERTEQSEGSDEAGGLITRAEAEGALSDLAELCVGEALESAPLTPHGHRYYNQPLSYPFSPNLAMILDEHA